MGGEKKRILCADDDEDTCTMMSTLLGQLGYEVIAAKSVAEALGLAISERFDMYILNSWFPDGHSIGLCQKIRTFNPRTPIIFFSGATYASAREEAVRAGAQVYIFKPDIEDLLRTISRLLNEQDGGRWTEGR